MGTDSTTSEHHAPVTAPAFRFSNAVLLPIIAVWGLLIGGALFALWLYGATPGTREQAPRSWPAQSTISRDARPTLLVFAHPLCPCTRATMAELARLVATVRDRADVHVLFIDPPGADDDWRDSDLRATALAIPGVSVHSDKDRNEARLFQVTTSGDCLLYDPSGELVFQGGITSARGHEGDSEGSRSLAAILLGEEAAARGAPVFGCPLFESKTAPAQSSGDCR
jgi:hypothetical protein